MYIVLLKFSENKNQASDLIQGHKSWIKRGFDEGVFILVGSLQPNIGGGILAHNTSLEELQQRVDDDPFVANKVVKEEVIKFLPNLADERLNFLLN